MIRLSKLLLAPSLLALGWVFLKIGLVFFGGGFVVLPVIHHELVQNLHWLTEREFIDGTAISQLTPGPIAVLATFAGFRVGGVAGALVATVMIFLPGNLLMLALSHSYESLTKMDAGRQVLDTLVPVVVGLLFAAAWQIGKGTMHGWLSVAVLGVSLVALVRFKVNPALLIVGAALLGIAYHP